MGAIAPKEYTAATAACFTGSGGGDLLAQFKTFCTH